MPQVPVNYVAVVVAAVASMILGFLWYGPLFGKLWMKLMGKTQKDMDEAKKKGMMKAYVLLFVGALITSYVLAHAIIFASTYLNIYGVPAGLMSGFFNWLGFIGPVTLGMVLWEGKSWKLWTLLNSFELVSLMVMGVILSLWK